MATDSVQDGASQWVFPSVSLTSGRYEVRISGGPYPQYDVSALASPNDLRVQLTGQGYILDIGELDKARFDTNGQLQVPSIDITFNDRWRYTGVRNGTGYPANEAIESDLSRYNTTVLNHIFASITPQNFRLYITRKKTDGTTQVVFAGNIDEKTIPKEQTHVHKQHTSSEVASQTVTITATALIGELTEKTIQSFVDHIGTATTYYAHGATERPFFQGFTWQAWRPTARTGFTYDIYPGSLGYRYHDGRSAGGICGIDQTNWYEQYMILAHGRSNMGEFPYPATFSPSDATPVGGPPRGTWGMTLKVLLERIAAVCGFDFTHSADFSTPLTLTYQTYNNATNYYEQTAFASSTAILEQVAISYNYWFGVSPYDATAFDSPITHKRDAPLADIIRDLCVQFGCEIDVTYNNTTGVPRIRLLSLRRAAAAFPTNLRLAKSRVTPRDTKATHVIVKNKGAEGGIQCPASGRGDAITIEVPFRTRAFGNRDEDTPSTGGEFTWIDKHIFPPAPKDLPPQSFYTLGARYSDGDENALSPNGWILASYLYRTDTTSASTYYPTNNTLNPVSGFTSFPQSTWQGYYGLRCCTEKAGTYTSRDNTLYALAQLYAYELIGDATVIERVYSGANTDGGDSLVSLTTGMEATWPVNGSSTTMRIERVRIDIQTHQATVTWRPKPSDYAALTDMPVKYLDGSGNTTGTVGGTATANIAAGTRDATSGTFTAASGAGLVHVEAASTANIAALDNTTASVDGYTYATGDKLLVKNQSTAAQNGVYAASTTGAWVRWTTDATQMRVVHVMRGTVSAGYLYELTTDGTIVVGTTSIAFALIKATDPAAITTYIGLTDTDDASYAGKAYYVPRVNAGATGLALTAKLLPTDGYLTEWVGDTLEMSRVETAHASAYITIPWESGDTKSTMYVGSTNASNNANTIVAQTYSAVAVSGSSVTGAAADFTSTSNTGAQGNSTSGVGVAGASSSSTGMYGQSATGRAGLFEVSGAGGTVPTVRIEGTQTAAPDLSVEGAVVYDLATALNVNLTLSGRHHFVEASTTTAAITITLPTRAAWNDGVLYVIYDTGRNSATGGRNITLNTDGTDQFNDAAVTTKALATNGAHWFVRGVRNTAGTRRWAIYRVNEGA